MHDCPRGDIRDRLPDLLHGRLDANARADVEQHVSLCTECAAELELLRAMRRMLTASSAVDTTRLAAAVRASEARGANAAGRTDAAGRTSAARRSTGARPRVRRLDWRVAAAAAVLVTGGLTVAVARRTPTSITVGRPISAANGGNASTSAPGLMFGGGVSDLSDGDIERLLQDVDSLSALPDVEPAPVLRGVDGEEL